MTEHSTTPAVSMRGIVKRFPGVVANDHVDFEALPGEVHSLLGENGAGKSTLMNILSGLYVPDEGEIRVFGKPVVFRSPRDAIAHGIGMVHQHFMLVEMHTVAENMVLGLNKPRFFLNFRQIEKEVEQLSAQYGLRVDPRARIWQLSVGEQDAVPRRAHPHPGRTHGGAHAPGSGRTLRHSAPHDRRGQDGHLHQPQTG